ncbi:hypothetical protein C0992_012300 [Termitomyces sp. T32_za158]|nr:hypothetical protein C0992_012300 [Termitomyces sp. T32_za158]
MDKFKKIKSKLFKSQPAPEPEPTYDYRRVHYVDIKPGQRWPGWPQFDDDPDDFTRPYFPRRPYVEKEPFKSTPAPPTTKPPAPRVRYVEAPIPESNIDFSMFPKLALKPRRPHVRAPHLDLSDFPEDFQFGPDASKEPKPKAVDTAEAVRNAAQLRGRQRASSSRSGQTQPLNIRRRGASDAPAPIQPSGTVYRNHAASQSTRSLDPRLRNRAGVPNLRQAGAAGTHSASGSEGSMYSNSSAAQSAYNVSQHARRPSRVTPDPGSEGGMYSNSSAAQSAYHISQHARRPSRVTPDPGSEGSLYSNSSAAQSAYNVSRHARRPSRVTPDPVPPVPPLPPQRNEEGASVCRRNASSASSRSAHDMRRHGMIPLAESVVHQEILRVLRGPHAAQLQNPSTHTRANEDIGLPINDTKSSKEWGAVSSKVGAATVSGYGRHARVY